VTRSVALRVDRQRGEELRRRLLAAGKLREDLEILRDGRYIVLPLRSSEALDPTWGELTEAEFELLATSTAQSYRDLLHWPADETRRLPRSFDVVGDIVVIRIPPLLRDRAAEIGEALRRFVPGTRLVGADFGVRGEARQRHLVPLAGGGSWRTTHRENGLDFEVDLERAYFSPRLAREHARVAGEVQSGERVFDLCCGVGPFALTIAQQGRAREIQAVDSNPAAIELLHATRARYPFGSRIHPRNERIEEFLSTAGTAERVILNLPHEGIKYLPSVAPAVAPGGHLYYYALVPRENPAQRKEQVMELIGGADAWGIEDSHIVHPYSPTSDLVAFTLHRLNQ
jgi:tRNA (guanine37-N1)-methyltransferase